MNENLDKNKLNKIINECIIIENTIKKINVIYQNIEKSKNANNIEIKFINDTTNKMIKDIKNFGEIFQNQNQKENNINSNEIIYKFKKCPEKVKQSKKYEITGQNENIITKTGTNGWMGAICENQLNNQIEYK